MSSTRKTKFNKQQLYTLTTGSHIHTTKTKTKKEPIKLMLSPITQNNKIKNKPIKTSSAFIKQVEMQRINELLSSVAQAEIKMFSRSLSLNYTPLTKKEKIKVFEDMNKSSNQRLHHYNDIFNQIKSQIYQIETNLVHNKNEANFPHSSGISKLTNCLSDNTIKTRSKVNNKQKASKLRSNPRNSYLNNHSSFLNYSIDPKSVDENKLAIHIKKSIADRSKLDRGMKIMKVYNSGKNSIENYITTCNKNIADNYIEDDRHHAKSPDERVIKDNDIYDTLASKGNYYTSSCSCIIQ